VPGRRRGIRITPASTDVLETQRLLLVTLKRSRLEEFVALTADEETMRYWRPDGSFGREEALHNFSASLERIRKYGFGRRWIIAKQSRTGLGFTETKFFGESCEDVAPDEVEIGWMVKRAAWGRGYATEAGRAVRDEAFERLDLDCIVAAHHPANEASARVIEKLGMMFEGNVVTRTGWPLRFYRLTRDEWDQKRRDSEKTARG
jgi:RimJ/RimL family protein N-acetyltransferase